MKQKRISAKWITQCFLLLLIMSSCSSEDEYYGNGNKPGEPLTIANAMDWYNQAFGSLPSLKSVNEGLGNEAVIEPMWNLAELFSDTLWYAVESPLNFDNHSLVIMTSDVGNYVDTHGNNELKQILRLIVLRSKQTGETYSFIMAVIPELDYMLNKGDRLDENKYLSRDSEFDGLVFFYTVDGEPVNGWLYKDGKIVGGTNLSMEGRITKKIIAVDMAIRVCGDYMVECGSFSGGGTDCITRYETIYINDGGGYSSGGGQVDIDFPRLNGGGGGGSSSGSSSWTNQSIISLTLRKIVAKNNIKGEGLESLIRILNEKLEECGYRTMYNYLTANDQKITSVGIDPSIKDPGNYNPWTNTMNFRSNNDISGGFPEEFIHFFQNMYYPGGTSQYTNVGRSNIEFEAKILQDILCEVKGLGCPYYGRGAKYSNYYDKWILAITKGGTYIPNYNDLLKKDAMWGNVNYWDFMEDFKTTKTAYNFPINNSLVPSVINFLSASSCK